MKTTKPYIYTVQKANTFRIIPHMNLDNISFLQTKKKIFANKIFFPYNYSYFRHNTSYFIFSRLFSFFSVIYRIKTTRQYFMRNNKIYKKINTSRHMFLFFIILLVISNTFYIINEWYILYINICDIIQ